MTSAVIDPAAPAADLNEADSAALFASLSAAKFSPSDDPTPAVVITHEHEDEEAAPAAAAADAPVVTETPAAPAAVVPAVVPAAAAPAAAATDIWSNASPELRAAHDAALETERQRYRSDIGRQAAHQRRIQILEQELAATRKPAAAAATDTPAPTTNKPVPVADGNAPAAPSARKSLLDDPAVQKSREEYPEAVEPFAKIIESLEGRLDSIDRDVGLTREDRAAQTTAAQEAALDAAHPDWRPACASPEFATWLEAQPKAIKEIVKRNGENVVDAEEAIAMVGNFKAHWALTHPAPVPTPVVIPATPAPTKLSDRRAAQLAAVTDTPKGAIAALPDGAPGGGDEAMFNHFVQKKAQKG